MTGNGIPTTPYGAVYFRKSDPPKTDWETDYRTAAEDGHNAFRHWFMWSAVEIEPGNFDWEDYDEQLDLAATNGLTTIIAEQMTAAPEWAFHKIPEGRLRRRDGSPTESRISGSAVTSGFPGLCLDNEQVRSLAENFLRQLVLRYKDHPGLGGYDIWNECGYPEDSCYCASSTERFREWLLDKYGDLRALGRAWGRYSFASWDQVNPPREIEPYADVLDWLAFRQDNAYRLMKWRAQLIRSLDTEHPVIAHGVAGSLVTAAAKGTDDWRAASDVDIYGLTWGSSRHGDEPWKQPHAMDLVRGASRGKTFWHAEAYAGPLWMQPQVIGRARTEGRIARPEDIRYWNMVSLACGARGVFYLRWRPLRRGPLFGAFGAYGMDGSRTDRSQMVAEIGSWMNDPGTAEVLGAEPVSGDVGIVYVPEAQLFTYAQQGTADDYTRAAQGAYQGFFDNNIQADFVHISDIEGYDFLYLPYPLMLTSESADRLKSWVADGGHLISEGCPAYFLEGGVADTTQPGHGMGELFGARESYVEFTPDLLDHLELEVHGHRVYGGGFLQAYEPSGGTPAGSYGDGRVAAVENRFGSGRTLLMGTFPGIGYGRHHDEGGRALFKQFLHWAGKEQRVDVTNPAITVRLQEGGGGRYVWALNPCESAQRCTVVLRAGDPGIGEVHAAWGGGDVVVKGSHSFSLAVGRRDATVLQLGADS